MNLYSGMPVYGIQGIIRCKNGVKKQKYIGETIITARAICFALFNTIFPVLVLAQDLVYIFTISNNIN